MYKVKPEFIGHTVSIFGKGEFTLTEGTSQHELEIVASIGHEGVEFIEDKPVKPKKDE